MKTMLTEDYLIRMINLALAAIARVFGLKTAGQYLQAGEVIDLTLEQLLGLRADLIKRLDDANLLASLTIQGILDTDRLQLVADLFKAEGEILANQKDATNSYWSSLRALNFYLEVVLSGGAPHLPAPHEKIDELVQALESYDLPPETRYSLYAYYEQTGSYAKANMALTRLIDTQGLQGDLLEEQAGFYQRLLEKTDEELNRGGIDRSKVVSDLAKIAH